MFWFGDLNFRLTGDDSANDIDKMIKENRLQDLFAKDQLSLIKNHERAFVELQEDKPTFAPTFKFEKGTSDYNLK